jgi:SAM-dependent methyltransferase
MILNMVDWGAGKYETTAVELEPVAQAVVEQAALIAGEDVLDLACGTGNAALFAAAQGARVIGVDAEPRLLEVARMGAQTFGIDIEVREEDLLVLPVNDASVDVILSVFGVIFAADPAQALREIARVLRPGGRVLVSAWVPAGPIDAMLGAMGRIMSRVTTPANGAFRVVRRHHGRKTRRRGWPLNGSHHPRRAGNQGHLSRVLRHGRARASNCSSSAAIRAAARSRNRSTTCNDSGPARVESIRVVYGSLVSVSPK